jgi:pimeloyl-ACP methyl ester carboxylesterase
MLIPPGFRRQSQVTPFGTMSYVEPDSQFWLPSRITEADHHRPELVFLHGFGGGSSSYEWSKVYPAFVPHYRVLAPDLLGWGASDHPDQSCSLDDYLASIWDFIDQQCEQPPIVVSSSLTAAMMVREAILHPADIKGLILVAPTGLNDFGKNEEQSIVNQIVRIPWVDKAIYSGAIATAEGIRWFLTQRQFADSSKISDEIVEAYLQSAQQAKADVAALAFVRGDLNFDLAHYLPKLTTPTAIIWGEAAQFTGLDTGQRLAALNPGAIIRFDILPDVGLTPQLESPAVTIGLIQSMIKDINNSNNPVSHHQN